MIFEKNYKKNKGAWPTAVGMMRGLSAKGDYKKALEYAKTALTQATDDINKKSIEAAIKSLEAGKALQGESGLFTSEPGLKSQD